MKFNLILFIVNLCLIAFLNTPSISFSQTKMLKWSIISGGDMGANPNGSGQFYRYAPSAVQITENIKKFWWCGNTESGVVRDSIIYRSLTLTPWKWSLETAALCPGTGSPKTQCKDPGTERFTLWDGEHVCDPEVIGGVFMMSGKSYSYAIFYLGAQAVSSGIPCSSPRPHGDNYFCVEDFWRSERNAIGVAFSNNLDGPWTKYAQPLIAYPNESSCSGTCWGVGQPSATIISGGRVLLFYTRRAGVGDKLNGVVRRIVDLSQFNGALSPTTQGPVNANKGPVLDFIDFKSIPPLALTATGLKDTRNTTNPVYKEWLNNISIVYRSTDDTFLMYRDGESTGDIVSRKWQVAYISGIHIWQGDGSWNVLTTQGAEDSYAPGFSHVNNGGLQRNIHGGLFNNNWLEVFPTRMNIKSNPFGFGTGLETYRMNTVYGTLKTE